MPFLLTLCESEIDIFTEVIQFVIFKPLSFCFKETMGFDVKAKKSKSKQNLT